MGRFIGAICVVAVVIPWFMRSLADGSVNLNGLALNFVSTVQEIITREPADWKPPTPEQNKGGRL